MQGQLAQDRKIRCKVNAMAKKLAFMTLGILHEPVGHPKVQGFVDRVPAVYDAADSSDGFIGRSERNVETWRHSWGPVLSPKCVNWSDDSPQMVSTLSFWKDLESVAAFAYQGAHGEAMKHRKDWFQEMKFPTYLAWWMNADDSLNWAQACERMDHLHENGPTPFAFNFSSAFDEEGNSYSLDSATVRAKSHANATHLVH